MSFVDPHRALQRELSKFLSAYDLCAFQNSLAELGDFGAELSEFSYSKQYPENNSAPMSY